MRNFINLFICTLMLGCSLHPAWPKDNKAIENYGPNHPMSNESIGEAHMTEDGTIILMLRAESDSALGDAILKYHPGDNNYEKIKIHLPDLRPGMSVSVPPWDE